MKLTINECLGLSVFAGSRVVAGKRNLETKVSGISVLEQSERDDVKKYVEGKGHMLLTGFFSAKNDSEKQVEVIKELAAKDVAALVVFFVGKVVPSLDPSVTAAADKLGLPLIVMPRNASVDYSQVIDAVMGKLLYGNNFSSNLISNTIYHLLDFEKHTGFPDALMAAAVSSGYQVIILSEDLNPILSIETRSKASIADVIRASTGEGTFSKDTSEAFSLVRVGDVQTYWGTITINGEKHFMFIVDNDDNYTVAEITKLAEIIEVAVGMWKYTPLRDSRSELVKALRRGNASVAYALIDELDMSEESIAGVFVGKGIENKDSIKSISLFEKETGLTVISLSDEEETYGLILIPDGMTEDYKVACRSLFADLKGREGVKIFNVIGVDGVAGAADGYRLINETWSFAQKIYPYKRVFTKYELALVSNSILLQLSGGFTKEAYLKLLKAFDELGGNKGKQLLETLETFVLDAGINSSKTAELMGIHPNTVQYRLKKINELLGAEITGTRIIPGITLALALKRIERVVN